jgi:predicted esterase
MHHPDYQEIGRRYRHHNGWNDASPLSFPEEGVNLFSVQFASTTTGLLLGHEKYVCKEHGLSFPAEPTVHDPPDHLIKENAAFRYLLVRDDGARRQQRAVILLHGLNERSFSKYISWAYQLWAALRAPVVLFPLSFHINRVNPSWMLDQQQDFARRKALEGNQNVHRFNAVMSDRLGTHPERFFWGGLQSYWDLVEFARLVREGKHPHISPDARLNFLGFSAGGFVALDAVVENHEGLFDGSRLALFATCAAMRDVNVSSFLIVDQMAEVALMNLYVKHMDKLRNDRLRHWMEEHPEGRWLNAFCGLKPDRAALEVRLSQCAARILGIANTNDQVFPPGAMYNALQGVHRDIPVQMRELDLGIHENPFSSPGYDQRDRTMITKFLDFERYGRQFEEFVEMIATHLEG